VFSIDGDHCFIGGQSTADGVEVGQHDTGSVDTYRHRQLREVVQGRLAHSPETCG
jgi:hypothetical protein